jgi:hypothetical protein
LDGVAAVNLRWLVILLLLAVIVGLLIAILAMK